MRFDTQEEAIGIHKERHGYSEGRIKQYTPGSEFFSFHRLRIKWITDTIEDGDKVLDVGCSAGEFMDYIMKLKPCQCVGVDVNEGAVRVAQDNGLNVTVDKAEELPFNDDTFDVVVLSEILEHLYDPAQCLREAHRVLKHCGKITGSVPHCDSIIIKDKPCTIYPFHARDFNKIMLTQLLNEQFNNVDIKEVLLTLIDKKDAPFWFVFRGENAKV